MDASHNKMMTWLTDTNDNREETMACQEKTEAPLEEEEPTSVDMEAEVVHEEAPKEDAELMPAPRNRRRADEFWPRGTRRNRIVTWMLGVAGINRNGPRAKIDSGRYRDDSSCSSGKTKKNIINKGPVDPKRDWLSPAEGRPAVRKWHATIKSSSGETEPRTTSYYETRKYGRSEGHSGRNSNI
jgi:hypothetical protein